MNTIQTLFDRKSGQVFQEPGMFAATDRVRLLYPAKRILKVENQTLGVTYEEGRDWVFDAAWCTLVRPAGSTIPALTKAELSPDPATAKCYPDPQANAVTGGVDGGLVLFNNQDFFVRHQVEITYETKPDTQFPEFPATDRLPRTRQKLAGKEPLRMILLGDSISEGYNSTAYVGVPPFGKNYIGRFADDLSARFGSKVELFNDALDGECSDYALKRQDIWRAHRPDLLVIAFGMNDLGAFTPEEYAAHLREVVQIARRDNPAVEVILITPMSGNPAWSYTPTWKSALFAATLRALANELGTACADVQSVWLRLLDRKSFYDLTGNGVNHPNDYGHRVYQAVLSALLA